MDISIEIASNKRMKKDYIKPFKLTFKDKDLEKKVSFCLLLNIIEAKNYFVVVFQYCHQKDYTFKSSLFCVVGVWLLVVFSETFQIGIHHSW